MDDFELSVKSVVEVERKTEHRISLCHKTLMRNDEIFYIPVGDILKEIEHYLIESNKEILKKSAK